MLKPEHFIPHLSLTEAPSYRYKPFKRGPSGGLIRIGRLVGDFDSAEAARKWVRQDNEAGEYVVARIEGRDWGKLPKTVVGKFSQQVSAAIQSRADAAAKRDREARDIKNWPAGSFDRESEIDWIIRNR